MKSGGVELVLGWVERGCGDALEGVAELAFPAATTSALFTVRESY